MEKQNERAAKHQEVANQILEMAKKSSIEVKELSAVNRGGKPLLITTSTNTGGKCIHLQGLVK